MALAPLWQYIVLVVLFSISGLVTLLGIGLMAIVKENGVPLSQLTEKKPGGISPGGLLFRTLAGAFGMYLSYSLFMWHGGPVGFFIIVAHWASVISSYLYSLINNGKEKEYSIGRHVFGLLYSLVMLAALVIYGVKWL